MIIESFERLSRSLSTKDQAILLECLANIRYNLGMKVVPVAVAQELFAQHVIEDSDSRFEVAIQNCTNTWFIHREGFFRVARGIFGPLIDNVWPEGTPIPRSVQIFQRWVRDTAALSEEERGRGLFFVYIHLGRGPRTKETEVLAHDLRAALRRLRPKETAQVWSRMADIVAPGWLGK